MMIYGFLDRPSKELEFIANSYGNVGLAPFYTVHFGVMALIISFIALISSIYSSLFVHFIVSI